MEYVHNGILFSDEKDATTRINLTHKMLKKRNDPESADYMILFTRSSRKSKLVKGWGTGRKGETQGSGIWYWAVVTWE